MSNGLSQALLLILVLAASVTGMVCFALSLDTHWAQLRSGQPLQSARKRVLQVSGAAMLAISLWIALRADHPGMAVLVWIMSLGTATVVVAFFFTRLAERLARAQLAQSQMAQSQMGKSSS